MRIQFLTSEGDVEYDLEFPGHRVGEILTVDPHHNEIRGARETFRDVPNPEDPESGETISVREVVEGRTQDLDLLMG